MKKIYMPNMETLYQMEYMGANVYDYILAKVVETLVMEGKIHTCKNGILNDYVYKYLKHDENLPYSVKIVYAICRMYPEEIKNSIIAENDINLCLSLMNPKENGIVPEDTTIYALDNLAYFENGVGTLSNQQVVETTIDTLSNKLPFCPRYRFEYKDNSLLDSIFACEQKTDFIPSELARKLVSIEPVYALKLTEFQLSRMGMKREELIEEGVRKYTHRYGISSSRQQNYKNVSVLQEPTPEVKKLLKCIRQHKI